MSYLWEQFARLRVGESCLEKSCISIEKMENIDSVSKKKKKTVSTANFRVACEQAPSESEKNSASEAWIPDRSRLIPLITRPLSPHPTRPRLYSANSPKTQAGACPQANFRVCPSSETRRKESCMFTQTELLRKCVWTRSFFSFAFHVVSALRKRTGNV